MNIDSITPKQLNFKSTREDRNTTAQLKKNNDYSLTEPNQRRINQAIENLAKLRGEENIRFLLDVGENLTYQTNIQNGKATKNEWKTKLKNATEESLAHSNPILKEKYQPEIDRVFADNKPLSSDEKAILLHKKYIMKNVDKKELESNPNENIRNLERNMDYFITSTETPTKQKRYIMSKLDYMMSPSYQINPQLKDKKTQVLAEMVNDLVINTPESKIPNIKAVNQKSHGMCAAISIARKAVAYEDKANYVDLLLSELDSKDTMEVYDRQNLGSGKKVPINKVYIDFDYAQEKGYRIIDASTLQWMNTAGMYGTNNENLHNFSAFDKSNFDAFHDSFFMQGLKDPKLHSKQVYYQSLVKAKDVIGSTKAGKIKSSVDTRQREESYNKNLGLIQKYNDVIKNDVDKILPVSEKSVKAKTISDLSILYQPTSEKLDKNPDHLKKYSFIPNEEYSQKIQKVKNYFMDTYSVVNREVLENSAESIVDSIQNVNALKKSLSTSNPLSRQVAHARKMYDAEAAYRASVRIGLLEEDNLNDTLIQENIPDNETRIVNGFSQVIDRIQNKNDKKLLNHFSKVFGKENAPKEDILGILTYMKDDVQQTMTTGLDELYALMGYGGRMNLISEDMKSSKESIIDGDKDEQLSASIRLGVKNDKKTVLKEYEKLEKKIEENPTDDDVYIEAFNKMGYKSQLNAFVDVFDNFSKVLTDKDNPQSEMYKAILTSTMDLPENATDQQAVDALNEIGSEFNQLAKKVATTGAILEVQNDDGTKYFTTNAPDIIMKRYEKQGKLVPEKDMLALQDRFTKIDKIRSQDEFSSRQGKVSDKSLYKLSNPEKEAVKHIDKKLNSMYSEVTRSLDFQYKEIKEPLANLARYIGTNEGRYWVLQDGQSGLCDDQQVKIFEQMTDKPYYSETNIDKAVALIKEGVHSGVSSSSVFHDRTGGHAQYVVDIKEDEKTHKDILYHDNTWGASEHENVWIDSEGLQRTDYSDRRGGELGYVTDKNWRNGNFVENLTHKKGHVSTEEVDSKTYKKITHNSASDYDFSLMGGIILPGENAKHTQISASIKDALFIPEEQNLDDLQTLAGNMTKKEIQKAIFRNETAGNAYHAKYNKIINRLNGDMLKSGISSLDDYNKLSDNDMLKVAFEKVAVRQAYPDATMSNELAGLTSVKDIEKVKSKQKEIAKSNFDYAFGKDEESVVYLAYDHGKDVSEIIVNALTDNKMPIDLKKIKGVVKGFAEYDKSEKDKFTGSVKDSINFVTEKILKQYDDNMEKSESSDKARAEIESSLRKSLPKWLYFDSEDLKQDSPKAKGIRNWIDEKFNPTTDEEFIQIYRNLQDMNKSDFDKLSADVTNEQLGISNETGYDMLIKVKSANDEAESDLRNVLFYDEFVKDLNMTKTVNTSKYLKTERKSRGMIYKGKRTFDDLYRSTNFSLSVLTYEKMFNKYKDESFRKYGALPAYPKTNMVHEANLNEKLDSVFNSVTTSMDAVREATNTVASIKLVHKLDDYRQNIPEGRKLTPTERKTINLMVGEFVTRNFEDKSIENVVQSAQNILELGSDAKIEDYNKDIDAMVDLINTVETINSVDRINTSIARNISAMKNYFNVLLKTDIPPQYHRIMKEEINDWIKEEIKQTKEGFEDSKDIAFEKVKTSVSQYGVNVHEKEKTEGLTRIASKILQIETLKESKTQNPEKIEKSIADLNKMSDRYVQKYVKPEYQPMVKAHIQDWSSKEIVGGKQQPFSQERYDLVKQRFATDYKRYHVLNHPMESLNAFLLCSAKDSEDDKTKETYKKYLTHELEMAKLVDIQDTLMEAVQSGNAAQVKNSFDDYYISADGTSAVSMNSDDAIDVMVRSLIIENNTKTAKMFVEKLGLGDRVMSIEAKLLADIKPKSVVDSMSNLAMSASKTISVANSEFTALAEELNHTDDVLASIDKSKEKYIEQTKGVKNKSNVKIYLQAMDKMKQTLSDNSEITPQILIAQVYPETIQSMSDSMNSKLEDTQDKLNAIDLVYKFLLDLHLPTYSRGYKIQQKLKNDYSDLTAYNDMMVEKLANETDGDGIVQLD
jgi:hypothetical protein